MGHQIIKQPNGKYAIWSSGVDNFIVLDATETEVVDEMVDMYRRAVSVDVGQKIAALDRGEKPYMQFTLSWEDALGVVGQDDPNEAEEYRSTGVAE